MPRRALAGAIVSSLAARFAAGPAEAQPGDGRAAPGARPYRTTDAGGAPFPFRLGVNLAGGDFGSITGPMAPAPNNQYAYPDTRTAEHFVARGLGLLRVPFKWERLMPDRDGGFRDADAAELDRVVSAIHARGGYPILSPHNYFRRQERGRELFIRDQIPQGDFNRLWEMLARRYGRFPRVVFELMNEPVGRPTEVILAAMVEATAAIRAQGARHLVLVPGNHWSGAHSWVSSDNGRVMDRFEDPENNWAFAMHQYLDEGASGAAKAAGYADGAKVKPGSGATVLAAATAWLRERGRRAMLTEFSFAALRAPRGAPYPESLREGRDLLDSMLRNRDVWLGGTYWMATNRLGPGDDVFNVEPVERAGRLVDLPQVELMRTAMGL